jgi:hypothetical protein
MGGPDSPEADDAFHLDTDSSPRLIGFSLADADPGPCVLGPSGSVSTTYGSGSGPGSICHVAKIVRKI